MHDIEHVNEDAELYALGALGDLERARVERHVRTCDECAARVGEASSAILQLIESDASDRFPATTRVPHFSNAPRAWIAALVAAAMIVAFLPFGLMTMRSSMESHRAQDGQQVALSAMLAGHFSHAPFVANAPGAPDAKVVYAREGGWIYVIAAPGKNRLDIAIAHDGRRTIVASMPPNDAVRSSFVAVPGRPDAVELLDRGAVLASARLVYPSQPKAR
jgi:hypothetical protein